jgi:hypothetical protein
MPTPTVTIHVVPAGTPTSNQQSSFQGHMWYVLNDGNGNSSSWGFSPIKDGDGSGPGQVNKYGNDDNHYLGDSFYSRTIEITQYQHDEMLAFGQDPGEFGFSLYYNGLNNSCVDFTWKALQVGGLNPMGFEGDIIPDRNIEEIGNINGPIMLPEKEEGDGVGGTGNGSGASDGPGGGGGGSGVEGTQRPGVPYDPLALDLDGDGLETRGVEESIILFDHDADGVKVGTGWVKPDDGWLVLDRNGNGKIDSADSVFANLRIWRDLNQDGVSQAVELTRLSTNNITSIGVTGTPTNIDLGNGNVQTASGTFTRTNDSVGNTGATDGAVGNLDLLINTFEREFTDDVPLTTLAKSLSTLHGSGKVRDLDEAISLSTNF